MPEILTESFCERCGTRYTFESAAPTKTRKLGKFKTLSKGLKNYVLSDDTSLDEAMAAARSDEEREQTVQQLDAFHATFNFCMTCRQYTCGNCWNEAEGRCLTCAPHLGHEIMPAPFPTLRTEIFAETEVLPEPERPDDAWPTTDLRISDEPIVDEPVAAAAADAESNGHYDVEEFDVAARLAGLTGGAPTSEPEAAIEPVAQAASPTQEADAELPWAPGGAETDVAPEATVGAEAPVSAVELDAVDAALPEAVDTLEPDAVAAMEPEAVESVAAGAPEPLPTELDDRAAAAAARTSALLNRFRPGQNIDDELAAFEASLDDSDVAVPAVEAAPEPVAAVAAAPEVVAAEPEPEAVAAEAEPEAVVAEPELDAEAIAAVAPAPEAEPEPVAAIAVEPEVEPVAALPAEPEPVAAEPQPEVEQVAALPAEPEPELVAAEAEPEPIAAEADVVAEPTPEPVAAAPEPEPVAASTSEPAEPRTDRVEQPTWRIVAPDVPAPATNGREPGDQGQPAAASAAPAGPTQPQWPATPQWPTAAPAIPYVNDRLTDRSTAALWAASAREVASLPVGPGPAPTAGVQPCANCGLSLSATARFCRRCGSRQGS